MLFMRNERSVDLLASCAGRKSCSECIKHGPAVHVQPVLQATPGAKKRFDPVAHSCLGGLWKEQRNQDPEGSPCHSRWSSAGLLTRRRKNKLLVP